MPTTLDPPPIATTIELQCAGCHVRLSLPVDDARHADRIRCPSCSSVFPLHQTQTSDAASSSATRLKPPVAPAQWEVDRTGYEGTALDLGEVRVLIKSGDLREADRIRRSGAGDWHAARDDHQLSTAFALRRKEVQSQLASLLRKQKRRCHKIDRSRASLVCLDCAIALCSDCAIITAAKPTTLACPDCGTRLENLPEER